MSKWHILYQNRNATRSEVGEQPFGRPGSLTGSTSPVGGKTPAQRLFASLRDEVRSPRVIAAMERVPRELFVSGDIRHMAYADQALPIEKGQTISQPLIVALMTSALELCGNEKVLEVGTGSGYQAAVLALLAREVVTVERYAYLATQARGRLMSQGIRNVKVYEAKDDMGYPEEGPYDAILVTAAAPRIPQVLLTQLQDSGRIVIPIGTRSEQELMQVTKRDGHLEPKQLGKCRFVPLIGDDAFSDEVQGAD